MIAAQLIIGGLYQERVKTVKKIIQPFFKKTLDFNNLPVDILLIKSEKSIGINQIRNLKHFLNLRPYQAKIKIGLILKAESLTPPAQNSLLKTLEEPPKDSLIILLANHSANLLPTIVSRTQIIRLPSKSQISLSSEEIEELSEKIKHLLTSRVGERVKESLVLVKNNDQALVLTEKLLFLWRQFLLVKTGIKKEGPDFLTQINLRQIEKAIKNTEQIRKMLVANVNYHLAIENLFLSYPHFKLASPSEN